MIVDLERQGKHRRQAGADTQINDDRIEDVARLHSCLDTRVVCRVNAVAPGTDDEIERVVAAGADEVLLPMVRRVQEVEHVLDLVDGRCGVGILIETADATAAAPELGRLPLTRVYVGLNDLAIERRSPNIFCALTDGTVDEIRRSIPLPFGVAGLTLPDAGRPIPCRLLIGELARLDCSFSFLRRSFLRDAAGREAEAIPVIKAAMRAARARPAREIERDRAELRDAIGAWEATDHAA